METQYIYIFYTMPMLPSACLQWNAGFLQSNNQFHVIKSIVWTARCNVYWNNFMTADLTPNTMGHISQNDPHCIVKGILQSTLGMDRDDPVQMWFIHLLLWRLDVWGCSKLERHHLVWSQFCCAASLCSAALPWDRWARTCSRFLPLCFLLSLCVNISHCWASAGGGSRIPAL